MQIILRMQIFLHTFLTGFSKNPQELVPLWSGDI